MSVDTIEELPPPTGNTVYWHIQDHAVFEEVQKLLHGIRQWTLWCDAEEVGKLRDQLTGLPGFPKMQPGDHIQARFWPKPVILTPRTHFVRPTR